MSGADEPGPAANATSRPVPFHLPADQDPRQVPAALGALHRRLPVGARVELRVEGASPQPRWPGTRLADVVTGAGFHPDGPGRRRRRPTGSTPTDAPRPPAPRGPEGDLVLVATRQRTLADTVGPGMRLLVAGLNPSLYSADEGIAFARPGNRFWPAAVAAGLVERDRDPLDALARHGLGMTDVVKRATPRADELTAPEYRRGLDRLGRLVSWLEPAAVCFVGLAGWRAAVDRRAVAGIQPEGLGGTAVYVMPSTSGVNGRSSLDDLTTHLRAAAELAAAGRAGITPAGGGAGG